MSTTSHEASTVEADVLTAVDALRQDLEQLALDVHARPELAWHEHYASERLRTVLDQNGFDVEPNLCDLPTAFRATHAFTASGPTIGLIAELDALPELGHACGHNLIGAAATGAAISLRQALSGRASGAIQVIGTPAEESGGGKIELLKRGAFEGLDAVMMFHPGARTMVRRGSLAASHLTMTFHGRAAHAATNPQDGINALDACIQTFNAINAMRQHFRDETRIHGIITMGGTAANIVPDLAKAEFTVRHRSALYLEDVKQKVLACARGAAASVGATVDIEEGEFYAERKNNLPLADRFASHLERLGEAVKPPPELGGVGSSDFNNVSQVLPAIHTYIKIVPEGTSNHTPEFARAAASPEGLRAMLLGAKALALTAADLLTDVGFHESVREAFLADSREGGLEAR